LSSGRFETTISTGWLFDWKKWDAGNGSINLEKQMRSQGGNIEFGLNLKCEFPRWSDYRLWSSGLLSTAKILHNTTQKTTMYNVSKTFRETDNPNKL
jgi:hypothetical protein